MAKKDMTIEEYAELNSLQKQEQPSLTKDTSSVDLSLVNAPKKQVNPKSTAQKLAEARLANKAIEDEEIAEEEVRVIDPKIATTKPVQPRQETQFEKDLFADTTKKPLGQHVEGKTMTMTDKAKQDYANQYNKKQQEELAEKNKKFGTYSFDNTAFDVKNKELLAIDDSQLTPEQIKRKRKAETKIADNQRDYEKFMDFVRQYDKYNQYGGSFNYDQFTSSVDPKVIRAAAKALGVKGLSNVGIATKELYDAARKEMQKKYDVAYQERQAIQAEKKKAEDALKDQIKDDAKRNELQEYIYNWSQALSGDPKDFEANQAEFIKGLQQKLADAGYKTRVDGLPEQQTFRRAIEAMYERNPELKDLFVASGVMMPVGYEKSTPLDKWLDGDDKEREEYELRFAQRRDQRNRFAQSLVDLAGITSRMIAASGGAKMEPYKNDMYDKFREDMTAARKRYDERMGEIRQREIDAEKEAYARIREREKAAQEQANLDRAFTYQQTQDRIKNAIEKGRLDLAAEELRLKKDENSPYYKSMMYQTRLNFLQNYKPADWAIMERYINGEDVDISGIMPVVKESTVNYNYDGVKQKTPPQPLSAQEFVEEKQE